MLDDVVEGQVLAGKYRVERVLGAGGMGVVVAAHHIQLDERVAIKFMLSEALSNGEAVTRFAREARAAVKIKSEHVARVSDVGVLENGAPYMVMEYLEGGDLSGWLKQAGRIPPEQAVEFVLQASEAIAEAHALGIVHRDLKPANLFVIRRPDGALSVKVLDFGISKMAAGLGSGTPDFGMTKTGAVMGSPLYMSPEQMRASRHADARSDIWSLGVILYELLSGMPPFISSVYPDLVLKIATEAPPSLLASAPNVPAQLEAVILRCLAKEPERRFATMAELAMALAEFAPRRSRISVERITGVLRAAGMTPSSGALPLATTDSTQGAISTGASWGQTAPPNSLRSRRTLLTTGAVLSLGLMTIAGYAVFGRGPKAITSAEQNAGASGVPTVAPIAPVASFTNPNVEPVTMPLPTTSADSAPAAPTAEPSNHVAAVHAATKPPPAAKATKPAASARPTTATPAARAGSVFDDR